MELKCEKCGRVWDYKGKKPITTQCPDCYARVKIPSVDSNAGPT